MAAPERTRLFLYNKPRGLATTARDPEGRIDIARTMQVITTVIEGWVREHPEQWLWLHRRWR